MRSRIFHLPDFVFNLFFFSPGSLLKSEVRQLAEGAGLSRVARRKESMGICFVGKRSFGRFVGEYVAKGEGGSNDFIDVDTGEIISYLLFFFPVK